MDKPIFEYNYYKNLTLLKERGIGFEDVISILETRGAVTVIDHPNRVKYPNQKIYILDIEGYAYLVPFERLGNKAMLKTIYPSRKMTQIYQTKLKGDYHDQKKKAK